MTKEQQHELAHLQARTAQVLEGFRAYLLESRAADRRAYNAAAQRRSRARRRAATHPPEPRP